MFNREGSAGNDVQVPRTSDPEILIWVNACSEEAQTCRQIEAINPVTLTENQSNETSEGSGQPVTQDVTLTARENFEHERKKMVYCSMLKRSSMQDAVNVTIQEHYPGETSSVPFE